MTTPSDVLQSDLNRLIEELAPEFRSMSGRNLLITGGGGFLGYYLVQAIVAWNRERPAGERVELTVWDNGARGLPAWLTALEGAPSYRFSTIDLTQPLPSSLPTWDFVIHAAGIASPRVYRRYPLETIDANITGLRALLDTARRQADAGHPMSGFLFFSSSEIYGDPPAEKIPTPEDFRGYVSCTGPRACYDESKRFGETLCVVYAQQYGVPTRMARPFNNYGPGLRIDDGRVIPDFARDILAGRDIIMHSDGSPTRCRDTSRSWSGAAQGNHTISGWRNRRSRCARWQSSCALSGGTWWATAAASWCSPAQSRPTWSTTRSAVAR